MLAVTSSSGALTSFIGRILNSLIGFLCFFQVYGWLPKKFYTKK